MNRAVVVLVALCAGGAQAAGVAAARFGSEHGHPTTENLTALYYNPAGLALGEGTRLYIDGVFAIRSLSYDRPISALTDTTGLAGTPEGAQSANAGEADLLNLVVSPFVAVASDLGVENFALALGFFVPFGGSASWDQNEEYVDSANYPGASDGTQRWYAIDGQLRSMYVSLGAAYRLKEMGLSFGAALNIVRSDVHSLRARNVDGSDHLVVPGTDDVLLEGRSELKVDGIQLAAGLGVIYSPSDTWWFGLSYQTRPNFAGGMTLKGTLRNIFGTISESVTDVEYTEDMPDIFRLGVRSRPMDDLEWRFWADYTRWSAFDRQCILDAANEDRSCSVEDDGSATPEGLGIVQNFERRWEDTMGFRASVSYWLDKSLELFGGLGYDGNAVPSNTLDPALVDMDKVTVSLGGRWELNDELAFAGTFTQVIYAERDTTGRGFNRNLETPSRQPGNDGVYNQSISLFNVALDWSF